MAKIFSYDYFRKFSEKNGKGRIETFLIENKKEFYSDLPPFRKDRSVSIILQGLNNQETMANYENKKIKDPGNLTKRALYKAYSRKEAKLKEILEIVQGSPTFC